VSLEQVSSFPNPDNRSVEHIEISTRFGSERNPRIDIDFGYSYSSDGAITYLISGEEHDVYAACAIVEDHVRTMLEKPPMSNGAARIVGGALAILGGGVLPMSIGVLIAKVQMLHKGHKTSMWPVYVMAVGLILIGSGVIISSLVPRLWPSATFLIGGGKNRYRRILELRKNLFWTVGISLIVCLAGGSIFYFFAH